jgi:hypothetical protein
MSYKSARQLTILFTCDQDTVEEGEAMFAKHAAWMEETHHREGDKALLFYTVSRGPELANPLDPSSAPTGDTTFVLTEIYAKRAGVEDHWRKALLTWDDFEAFATFARKCRITTLHGAEIVEDLW